MPTIDSGVTWKPVKEKIPVLTYLKNPSFEMVDALVCGPVAVHKSIQQDDKYTVTARSIGHSLTHVNEEKDAIEIAEICLREFRYALTQPTPDTMRQKLPKWVAQWMLACKAAGKRVDHIPYVNGEKVTI